MKIYAIIEIIVIVLLVILALMVAGVLFAFNPPSLPPPEDGAAIVTDANRNIGIGVMSADIGAKLDVGGQIRIRGGQPAEGKVLLSDNQGLASWDYPPSGDRVWGEGRPGFGVLGVECVVNNLKISRSVDSGGAAYTANWGSAASLCPKGWWLCTAAERGTGACDLYGSVSVTECTPSNTQDEFKDASRSYAWLADHGRIFGGQGNTGAISNTAGGQGWDRTCTLAPAWCCTYN